MSNYTVGSTVCKQIFFIGGGGGDIVIIINTTFDFWRLYGTNIMIKFTKVILNTNIITP